MTVAAVPLAFPVTLPVMFPENVPVIVPPSILEDPTSMAPNPLVIEPPLRAPVEVSELVTTVDLSSVPVSDPAAAAPAAAHDGTPEANVRTSVSEPLASLASVVDPLAYSMSPAA